MWDTIPQHSSKICLDKPLSHSAQGSRSCISGFLSAHSADRSFTNFYRARQSHSHSPSCAIPTGNHTQLDSKDVRLLCDIHTLGKQCLTNYSTPLNPNWSDSEGEEDWNDDKQKQKELKKLELKNDNIPDPKAQNPSPCP